MDRTRNPYAPGAGTPPPELAGRADVLEDARVALVRLQAGRPAQGMVLVGLRGVGKTVLLNEVAEQARQLDQIAIRIEAHENKSLPELLIPQIKEAIAALSRIEAARMAASRALRVVKSFVSSLSVTIEGVTYGLTVDAEAGVADSGDLEADLPRLIEVLGEAAATANKPIVFVIDELQYLGERELSALIMGLHRANQRRLPILLIAAALPPILAQMGNSKSYAERLFRFADVGPLPAEAARSAVQAPAEKEGARFSPEALEAILLVTQRYPYFLQQWAHDSWNLAAWPTVSARDVASATAVAIAQLDSGFFRVRFDRCTPKERRYMRALAELGPGPHRSGDIATRLGIKVTTLGPVRTALIRKGMIYSPAHGDTAFTVPLFDQYMLRAMPQ